MEAGEALRTDLAWLGSARRQAGREGLCFGKFLVCFLGQHSGLWACEDDLTQAKKDQPL